MPEIQRSEAELKKPRTFTICGCKGTMVTDSEGRRHIELECRSKKDRDEAAAVFEEEVVLRVNPKVLLEGSPEEELPGTEDQKIIQGKTDLPGYKYMEHLGLSVREE